MEKIKVTIWNEGRHEKTNEAAKAIYPNGIHNTIKENLEKFGDAFEIRVATLDDPDQGLSDDLLRDTDVLLWWGHMGVSGPGHRICCVSGVWIRSDIKKSISEPILSVKGRREKEKRSFWLRFIFIFLLQRSCRASCCGNRA